MARLDVEFVDESCGFVSANEDFIERKILKRVKEKNFINLSSKEYEQLSPRRTGVLEWYPFNAGEKVLELGAGMGALTELFVERECIVTCVEVKKSRVEIIKERLKDRDNLEVVCANPVLYDTKEKFNYVIIHDAWGFVKKYNKVQNAYELLLEKIKHFLLENGHLIIIADNRLALKYFSGSIDEYSRKLFVGLENYKNYSYIKSFDKQELLELLDNCGFISKDMYYINSDYYFTDKIYTDYALQNIPFLGSKFSTSYNAFNFFDGNIVYNTLQKNGIVDRFVDAFIVDCYFVKEVEEKLVFYQSGEKRNEGIAVVLLKDQLVKKRFNKDLDVIESERIEVLDWNKMIKESTLENEHVKNNISFPFVDPVEILNVGKRYGVVDRINEDDLQLIHEEKLIKGFIGELYENQ